ncbi:MAG: 2-aminoethylphosphonate--pyruvate transaminase [Oscillospiraceae bacterium]|nr:2-aminoethylphosphonate--pyruvate transaminase [Oscillospiraceae bacterium]MCL2279777.1 2-aminoethylphosphonate--pyruvate transaminase [Oscillospiraceae bacterium]
MLNFIPDNPYILLTPGPLSTSKGVRAAMLRDWCTWDADYNESIVQNIRRRLVALATKETENYTTILMQGSGSFSVEACLGTVIPKSGKVLILTNGAYGDRMVEMVKMLNIDHTKVDLGEITAFSAEEIERLLTGDKDLTHVAFVHCETTTGMLNPLEELSKAVKSFGKVLIVDAMSSFGGIPMDIGELGIDFLVSSSNKCIQGVPGFGFVIAKRDELEKCAGNARSLCMDLIGQWKDMEKTGKWRYTSPTHVVRAFFQALDELEQEGGISERHKRYCENHRILVDGMRKLGFKTLLPDEMQAPIITSFLYPSDEFEFKPFYEAVKSKGFVLYPGKISQADTFRIGNIGEVYPEDMKRLIEAIGSTFQA